MPHDCCPYGFPTSRWYVKENEIRGTKGDGVEGFSNGRSAGDLMMGELGGIFVPQRHGNVALAIEAGRIVT